VQQQRNDLPIPEGYTMGDIYSDNHRTEQGRLADEAFQKKSDKYFQTTHPGLINGRNFLWNVLRHQDGNVGLCPTFKQNYDATFKGCPGSPEWLDFKFCSACGKRKTACTCDKG
jgi:hypothetical protein